MRAGGCDRGDIFAAVGTGDHWHGPDCIPTARSVRAGLVPAATLLVTCRRQPLLDAFQAGGQLIGKSTIEARGQIQIGCGNAIIAKERLHAFHGRPNQLGQQIVSTDPLGQGTIKHRIIYAAETTIRCKGDNGKWQPNVSNLLGDKGWPQWPTGLPPQTSSAFDWLGALHRTGRFPSATDGAPLNDF